MRRSTQQPPALSVTKIIGSSVVRFAAGAFFRRLWVSSSLRLGTPPLPLTLAPFSAPNTPVNRTLRDLFIGLAVAALAVASYAAYYLARRHFRPPEPQPLRVRIAFAADGLILNQEPTTLANLTV